MKTHSEPTPEDIAGLSWDYRASRVLLTAQQLGVFNALGEPLTAEELSRRLSTDPAMTASLLGALCAMGILGFDGKLFSLSAAARDSLRGETPGCLGNLLDHNEYLWWLWSGLPDAVRSGHFEKAPPPPMEYINNWHRNYILAMHGIATSGEADWLVRHTDLAKHKRLLDVGGGPGSYSIWLCRFYPELKATIFDLPETLTYSRENVARYKLGKRISFKPGDWDKDGFGSGFDALLMSNILHGAGSEAAMKLGKAYQALDRGGLLIIHDFVLNNDGCGPLGAALFKLSVGAYRVGELADIVSRAGFSDMKSVAHHPNRGSSILTAIKPSR